MDLHDDLRRYLTGVKMAMRRRDGMRYKSVEDLLLDRGVSYGGRDVPVEGIGKINSRLDHMFYHLMGGKWQFTTGKVVGHPFPAGECYKNAMDLVLARRPFDKAYNFHPQYCEGLAVHHSIGFPMMHAWVLIEGIPYDVTWRDLEKDKDGKATFEQIVSRVVLNAIKNVYCGIIIPIEEVVRLTLKRKAVGPVLENWEEHFPLLRDGIPEEWYPLYSVGGEG